MNTIETERLYIRRFREEDWKDLYEYLSDPITLAFEPYEPLNEEQCKQESKRRVEDDKFYAVCLKGNHKLIGNLYVCNESEIFSTWEMGYVFNNRYHGQGYASESAKAMLEYLFTEKNARRVIAMCDPNNPASWKLLERIGMQKEAFFRKNVYFKKDENGYPIWKDTYVYAILAN